MGSAVGLAVGAAFLTGAGESLPESVASPRSGVKKKKVTGASTDEYLCLESEKFINTNFGWEKNKNGATSLTFAIEGAEMSGTPTSQLHTFSGFLGKTKKQPTFQRGFNIRCCGR